MNRHQKKKKKKKKKTKKTKSFRSLTLLTTPTPRALSLSSLIPAQHRHRPQVLVDQDLPRIPLFLLFPPLSFLSSFFFFQDLLSFEKRKKKD